MKKSIIVSFMIFTGLVSYCNNPSNSSVMAPEDGLPVLTILYDNYQFNKELKTNWGFACLIEGLDKTILFDTGSDDKLLLSNMSALNKNPADVDIVILSHNHDDHTGGLKSFLEKNPDVLVYLPASFPDEFKEEVRASCINMIEVTQALEIIEGVHLTGEMGKVIIEQSLLIETSKGNIVMTGCAHPGISEIVEKSREISNEKILLVMGGFHLLRTGINEVTRIAEEFHSSDISYAAPTHCSGDGTIKEFKNIFGENFLSLGVGRIVEIAELE